MNKKIIVLFALVLSPYALLADKKTVVFGCGTTGYYKEAILDKIPFKDSVDTTSEEIILTKIDKKIFDNLVRVVQNQSYMLELADMLQVIMFSKGFIQDQSELADTLAFVFTKEFININVQLGNAAFKQLLIDVPLLESPLALVTLRRGLPLVIKDAATQFSKPTLSERINKYFDITENKEKTVYLPNPSRSIMSLKQQYFPLSVQDLIDTQLAPGQVYKNNEMLLNLSNEGLTSLRGLENISGIRHVERLMLEGNFLSLDYVQDAIAQAACFMLSLKTVEFGGHAIFVQRQ